MKNKSYVSGGAVLLLALLYFFGGAMSLAALLTAVLTHELGHVAAILLLGGRIRAFCFDISGMCIDYSGISSAAGELAAVLAGPVAGLLLAYAASAWGNHTGLEFFLLLSGYSFALTALNIVPALPLDGGRAQLIIITRLWGRERAERFAEHSGMILSTILILIGLYLLGRSMGAALLICGIWLLIAQSGIVKNLGLL